MESIIWPRRLNFLTLRFEGHLGLGCRLHWPSWLQSPWLTWKRTSSCQGPPGFGWWCWCRLRIGSQSLFLSSAPVGSPRARPPPCAWPASWHLRRGRMLPSCRMLRESVRWTHTSTCKRTPLQSESAPPPRPPWSSCNTGSVAQWRWSRCRGGLGAHCAHARVALPSPFRSHPPQPEA